MKKHNHQITTHRGFIFLGIVCLLNIFLMQAFQVQAMAKSGGARDQFPGRRQGGGTHWVLLQATTTH